MSASENEMPARYGFDAFAPGRHRLHVLLSAEVAAEQCLDDERVRVRSEVSVGDVDPLVEARRFSVARGGKRGPRKFSVQVPIDRAGLVQDEAVVVEDRHLAEGVYFQVPRQLLLSLREIDQYELRLVPFFSECQESLARVDAPRMTIDLHFPASTSVAYEAIASSSTRI
jgi:hypothetical protein